MVGRRRQPRWAAVWAALVTMVAAAGPAEDITATGDRVDGSVAPEDHVGARTWLVIQVGVAADAVATHELDTRAALERLASSQPIELFWLRDDGYANFVATAHAAGGHGDEALDTLPRALLGGIMDRATAPEVVADGSVDAGAAPPIVHRLRDRPELAYRPSPADAEAARPTFFHYAFFRVPRARLADVGALLARRRELFRQRQIPYPYDVLHAADDTDPLLLAIAVGATDRAALDVQERVIRKRLGRLGRGLDRELSKIARPAGSLEGSMVLAWAGTPVEASLAARGLPPGGWVPAAVPLEPISGADPPALVAVVEPLPPAAPSPPGEAPAAPPPTSARPTTSPTPSVTKEDSLRAVVYAWAQAWSEQRADDYLDHYASGFRPPDGLSRAAWEARRRDRLSRPRFIEVTLAAIETRLLGPRRAWIEFDQSYRSDRFVDRVTKRLELVSQEGQWRIQHEIVLD